MTFFFLYLLFVCVFILSIIIIVLHFAIIPLHSPSYISVIITNSFFTTITHFWKHATWMCISYLRIFSRLGAPPLYPPNPPSTHKNTIFFSTRFECRLWYEYFIRYWCKIWIATSAYVMLLPKAMICCMECSYFSLI